MQSVSKLCFIGTLRIIRFWFFMKLVKAISKCNANYPTLGKNCGFQAKHMRFPRSLAFIEQELCTEATIQSIITTGQPCEKNVNYR